MRERSTTAAEPAQPAWGPGAPWRRRVRGAPVTLALIGVCLGVFVGTLGVCITGSSRPGLVALESLWSVSSCGEVLVAAGGLEAGRVWVDGQWWRTASTGLLHASWLHVILNTWSLWVVGEWAERTWGRARLLVLFTVSSVLGCLASVAWAEAPMVVGASAGVLGVAGALLVGRLVGRGIVAARLRPISARALGATLLVLLAIGFAVPVIAQAGHIGGLVVGGLLGFAWSRPGVAWSRGIGWLGVTVVALGLTRAAQAPESRSGYHEFRGYRLLELGRDPEATNAFEAALAMRPEDPRLANAVAYGLAKAGRDLDRAEELVEVALADDPQNVDYLDTLGWIHCRRGEVDAGLERLRAASEGSAAPVAEIEEHLETCADVAVSG